MIRLQVGDPENRASLTTFLRLSGLSVTQGADGALYIDFATLSLDEEAQLTIVRRMIVAWERKTETPTDSTVENSS